MISKSTKAIPFELIDLQQEGLHLKVNVLLNGKSIALLIDTGASRTVFDLNFIKENFEDSSLQKSDSLTTGIGTNTLESFSLSIAKLTIGNIEIENFKTAVVDLSHLNETYQTLSIPMVQGVLGNDILNQYEALIDYKNKQFWLNKKTSLNE